MKWQAEVHQQRLPTSRFFTGLASILVLLVANSTWASGRAESASAPRSWSALGRVDAFMKILDSSGFSVAEGKFGYRDAVWETCNGLAPQAGTNPWPNVTLFARLPADSGPYWQLGKDEAIVLVGQTPPAVKFFHYQTFAITVPGIPHRMMLPVGDAINMATINTIGPDNHDTPIVYIITGNREAERLVRAAALRAGYPEAIINVEAISPVIAPLGFGAEGSVFALVHRTAVPLDQEAMKAYATLPLHRIFRVTPKPNQPLKEDPEPVPVLRVRGTGHTEMSLYPSLKKLRQSILDRYSPMPAKELDSKLTQELLPPDYHEALCDKPYVGLQRGIDVFGASRDTVSITTYPRFRLRDGTDEFVIVYGVNHQTSGKATYSNFTLYADNERWLPVTDGSRSSDKYDVTATPGDSARRFLCPGDAAQCPPDVQYLYAWKVARKCNGEPYCMELKAYFVDMDDRSYGCTLYDWTVNPPKPIGPFDLSSADLNFSWRAYVEPATSVGPDDNELLYDRAIYFGPYFTGP